MNGPKVVEYGRHQRRVWDPDQPWSYVIGSTALSMIFWSVYALALYRGNRPGSMSLWLFVLFVSLAAAILSLAAVRWAMHQKRASVALMAVAGFNVCTLIVCVLALPWVSSLLSSRSPCIDRLAKIGDSLFLYAQDHEGLMPDKLEQLVEAKLLAAEDLVCPLANSSQGSSYKYVAGGRREADLLSDEIIAYELLEVHKSGANFLYGDGHTEWIDASGYHRVLTSVPSK